MRLIDGRQELRAEITQAPPTLRRYVAEELGRLARRADFEESLEAALPPDAGSQARARLIAARWRTIVSDSAIGGPPPS